MATDSEWRSRLRQDFALFSDREPESKICEKPDLEPSSADLEPFSVVVPGVCVVFKNLISLLNVGSTVAGVWTGVGFSNLKNFRIRIQKFYNRRMWLRPPRVSTACVLLWNLTRLPLGPSVRNSRIPMSELSRDTMRWNENERKKEWKERKCVGTKLPLSR